MHPSTDRAHRRRARGAALSTAMGIGMVIAIAIAVLAAQAPAPPPAAAPAPAAASTAAPPQFRTDADVVVVEGTVLDKAGRVVSGLKPADFTVEIGGKPREVLSADLVEYAAISAAPVVDTDITTNDETALGRRILIVIDRDSLVAEGRSVIDAAKQWITLLPAGDRVGMVALPPPGPRIEFTTDHQKVVDALDKVSPAASHAPPPYADHNVSIWEAVRMNELDVFVRNEVVARECPPTGSSPFCPDEVAQQARAIALDAQTRVEPVLASLRGLLRGLGAVAGPKHVVLLSSGWPISEREIATDMTAIAAVAAASNVILHSFTAEQWALAAAQRRPSPRAMQDRLLLLGSVESLAGLTGGRMVRVVGKGDEAFRSLNSALTGYYRLGVRPAPEDLDGKPHRITLKVLREGASLAGYRRVITATAAAAPAADADPAAELRAALLSNTPLTALSLRATSYVLHAEDPASHDLRVVVVGDVTRGSAGPAVALAALYDRDGKPVAVTQGTIDALAAGPSFVSVAFSVPAGRYTMRLAVRDALGHLGSLERPVDAQWIKAGTVETPGLVLMQTRRGSRAAPVPVFDNISTADDVIAQISLAGADPKTEVVFEVKRPGSAVTLLRRTGRIAQTTSGATVAQEVVPGSMLPPGRYSVTATIRGTASFTRLFGVVAAPPAAGTPPGTPASAATPAGSPANAVTRATPLAFGTPARFSTASLLDPGVVAPVLVRLAARPEAAAVRDAIDQIKGGPWPTDPLKGPLASTPVAAQFVAGLGRLQNGDAEQAAQAFRAALRAAPDFAPALTYLGACYAAGGKDQEAAGAWQVALIRERTPELQRLAIDAWLRADRPDAALALITQARQRWPDDPTFVRFEAQAAIAGGRRAEGIDLVSAQAQPDAQSLMLALGALYDAAKRRAPVWDAARDVDTMRRLRDRYAAINGESLALVDAWIAEVARVPGPSR